MQANHVPDALGPIVRGDPDGSGLAALEASRHAVDSETLNTLIDLLREPAIEGNLIRELLRGLGWNAGDYHGFDHLTLAVRTKILSDDSWTWHRRWMKSALPKSCKAKLALDLVLLTRSTRDIQEVADLGLLPKSIINMAYGQQLAASGRAPEALKLFKRAVTDEASSGAVFRLAGDDAYRSGQGLLANEWFHISLHADDIEAFDFTVKTTSAPQATERCLHDYYGVDYVKSGPYFVAQQPSVARQKLRAARLTVASLLPEWLRARLRSAALKKARRLARQLVNALIRLLDAAAKVAAAEQPSRAKSLLYLCRKVKAAARTV